MRSSVLAAAVLAVPLAGGPATLAAQSRGSLAQRVQQVMRRPEFKHAEWGIEFYSLDTGKPVYTVNADKFFVPASTTKLLTEGTTLSSRFFIAAWNAIYSLGPSITGGCRPLPLAALVAAAGLQVMTREVLVQWAFPSEIVVAR